MGFERHSGEPDQQRGVPGHDGRQLLLGNAGGRSGSTRRVLRHSYVHMRQRARQCHGA